MRKIDRLRKQTKNEALEELAKHKRFCIVRPTGFGKTGILTEIVNYSAIE